MKNMFLYIKTVKSVIRERTMLFSKVTKKRDHVKPSTYLLTAVAVEISNPRKLLGIFVSVTSMNSPQE